METVTIELDDQSARVVRELATTQKRPESDVVRDAISTYAAAAKRSLPKGTGKYRSGRRDVSASARAILREAVRENKWP